MRWLPAAVAGLVLATVGGNARAGRGHKSTPPAPGQPTDREPPLGEDPPPVDEGRMIVSIVDIRVEGMPAGLADDYERLLLAMSADMAREALWIGTRARMKQLLAGSTEWMEGCLLGPCMKVVREQARAVVALTVFLQNLDTTYRYVITLVRTDTGAVIDQRTQACGACTQAEALNAATTATLDALISAPGKLAESRAAALVLARTDDAPYKSRLHRARSRTRTTALVLAGLAAIGGGLGGYWYSEGDEMAEPTLGAAAGLAVAGLTCFAVSLTWD